ncbi:MAG TPA: DNA polymerase/3'-5' exonuclease PolX [Solirubrobacterales bacterium]|jgi:DNA polymerase (family 10)|nr:DNA polymerase/3'-5' exonuclease PolX [Solirubrobacterales bacterium]
MRNAEIAAALRELGILYELDGADRFRVQAYREAARTARDSPVSLEQLAAEDRLTELPNFGKTLADKVVTLIETGSIPSADKLKAKFPASLVDVTRVPGLGAKTARRLYDELGVESLEDLKEAAEQERIRGLKGLGPRVEENVLVALETLPDAGDESERRLLSMVLPIAEELAEALEAHPATGRVAIAGSARRWTETCKDIDLVATAKDPAALAAVLSEHELIAQAAAAGDAGTSVLTHTGIRVDLRITAKETFGDLLQHFTGSAEHNVHLRERALGRGLSVSEHGVAETEGSKVHRFAEEAGVYELLGLPYIEPELRQGRGEIEAGDSGELPELVKLEDIRGDLHSHTTLSDGRNSLEEMAAAARKRGYAYFAITDHSASHGFGDHVMPDQLEARIEEVRAYNENVAPRGFRLLAGSEVNIGTDGAPDYDDELLAALDWVIASVHTSFNISEKSMTDRIVTAIEHPLVDCIGHLTGRLLLRREPYAVDVQRVIEAAARTGTMLEINGNPNRRDLNEGHARLAAEAGVTICCNTDAHGVDTLSNMRYSVATARRAWLTKEQVANTRPWRSFAPLRKRHRA